MDRIIYAKPNSASRSPFSFATTYTRRPRPNKPGLRVWHALAALATLTLVGIAASILL